MIADPHGKIGLTIGIGGFAFVVFITPLLLVPNPICGSAATQKAVAMMVGVILLGAGCFSCRSRSWSRTPFALPLVLLCVLAIFQSFRALNPDEASLRLSILLATAFIALATAWLIDGRWVWMLVRGAALGALLASILGILEYLGVNWAMFPSSGRPSATFGFRNIAGMYLAVTLPLCALLFVQSRRLDFWLGTAAMTFMAVFLMFTRTRGAWLGVAVAAVGMGVLVYRWNRVTTWHLVGAQKRKHLLVFLGLLCMCFLSAFVVPRFQDTSPSRIDEKKAQVGRAIVSMIQPDGDRGRLRVWKNTMAMIVDHPLWGVGFGNWAPFFPMYDKGETAGITVAPRRPHNDLLWIWSETGAAGVLLLIWLFWGVLRQVWHSLKASGETSLVVLCAAGSVVALGVHSCFSFPSEQPAAMLPFGVALGLAGRRERVDAPRQTGRWIWGCIGIGVGVLGLWRAVDAMRFEGHWATARAAQQWGNVGLQIREAQQAQTYGLFDHRILLLAGEGFMAQGDYEKAVSVYQDYLGYQPHLPGVLNNSGRAYEALGNDAEAEKCYREGLMVFEGHSAVLLNNLAAVCKKQGRVDEALEIYQNAPQLDANGYHNWGVILAERGDFAGAQRAYEKALAQAPDMTIALFSMAGVKMLAGNFEGAADDYEAFLTRWDGIADYVRDAEKRLRQLYPVIGDRALRDGDLKLAERAYRRVTDLGVATPEIYHNLSMIYGRTRRYKEAIEAGQRALERDPDFAQAHLSLALAYEGLGAKVPAVNHYRQFLSLWRGDPALKEQVIQRLQTLDAEDGR